MILCLLCHITAHGNNINLLWEKTRSPHHKWWICAIIMAQQTQRYDNSYDHNHTTQMNHEHTLKKPDDSHTIQCHPDETDVCLACGQNMSDFDCLPQELFPRYSNILIHVTLSCCRFVSDRWRDAYNPHDKSKHPPHTLTADAAKEGCSTCSSGSMPTDAPGMRGPVPMQQGRPSGGAAVGTRQRMPLGWVDLCLCSTGRPPGGAAVGTRQRMPLGWVHLCLCSRGGHLEVLQWARANGCPWDERPVPCCSRGGHLEVLQWARANGCPWDDDTCADAARGGHLEVLQWARANGCPWDEKTCAMCSKGRPPGGAAVGTRQGCPWDERTCANAARGGHLEVLQWARANGCPWDESTCA